MQVLAFVDLCQLSEERGMGRCRRTELFELVGSEPVATWNMVAASCLGEIQALIVRLAACVARDSSTFSKRSLIAKFHKVSACLFPQILHMNEMQVRTCLLMNYCKHAEGCENTDEVLHGLAPRREAVHRKNVDNVLDYAQAQ